MQQQQLSGLATTTIMKAYNFCNDYFSIADEVSTMASSTAETTPLNGEHQDQSDISRGGIPQRREMDGSDSCLSLQAYQLNLSPVPEHKIAMSSMASLNASFDSPISHLPKDLQAEETDAKDSVMESSEVEPTLVSEFPPPDEVTKADVSDAIEPQPSWETPVASRLRDYSKVIGELPNLSPSSLARIAPVPKKTEYMQSLNADDDAPLTESDINNIEKRTEDDGMVQFFLRVPKSKKLRQTRQRRNVDRTLSGLKTKSQKQIANLRRQNLSNESDASDRTPKYVAPFPMPLSRDSSLRSESNDNSLEGVSPQRDRYSTPEKTARRMSFVAGSKINRFDSNGKNPHLGSGSADSSMDGRENSVGQMIHSEILNKRLSNGSKNQRMRSGSPGLKGEAYGETRRNFPPQKSASDADPGDVLARTGRKMISRRGSFVAGSKIEHFDGRNRNFHSRVKEGLGDLSLEFDRSDRRNRPMSSRTGPGELNLDSSGSTGRRRHRAGGRRVLSLDNSGSSQMKCTPSARSEESHRGQSLENRGSRRSDGSRRRSSGAKRAKRPSSSRNKEGLGNLTLD